MPAVAVVGPKGVLRVGILGGGSTGGNVGRQTGGHRMATSTDVLSRHPAVASDPNQCSTPAGDHRQRGRHRCVETTDSCGFCLP